MKMHKRPLALALVIITFPLVLLLSYVEKKTDYNDLAALAVGGPTIIILVTAVLLLRSAGKDDERSNTN